MGKVVSEDLLFSPHYKPMGVTDTQDVARGLMLVSTRYCYLLNIYMASEKIIFLSFSQKSIGAINPQGVTSFDPRGLIGWIFVGYHLKSLHTCTKYKSCGPHGFRDVFPLKVYGSFMLSSPMAK